MTQDTSMNINEILDHLPHRYPFVLVDKVISYEINKKIEAVKNVTINEPFFPGHFPHYPVMPGILIVEAMAQAAAILSFKTINDKPNDHSVYYFAGVDNARTAFIKPIFPSWIKSRKCRPRLVYFFAIEITRRKLASIISFLAARVLPTATKRRRLISLISTTSIPVR